MYIYIYIHSYVYVIISYVSRYTHTTWVYASRCACAPPGERGETTSGRADAGNDNNDIYTILVITNYDSNDNNNDINV